MSADARPAAVRYAAALAALPLLPLEAACLAALIAWEAAKGWPEQLRKVAAP